MTNARFASPRGLPVALLPFDDARSTAQFRALVTSAHPQCATIIGGLPSVARRRDAVLRLRFAKRFTPHSAPLSPLADRRPKRSIHDSAPSFRQPTNDVFQIFQSVIEQLTSHLAGKEDSAMNSDSIV